MDEIMELLKQLGNNYPSNFIMDRNRDIEIDQLLMKYYKGFYDITKIMKNVRMQNNCYISKLLVKSLSIQILFLVAFLL